MRNDPFISHEMLRSVTSLIKSRNSLIHNTLNVKLNNNIGNMRKLTHLQRIHMYGLAQGHLC